MSEPIQSIAQNNYILHNIDAKKLYVQEPLFTANSGDAVYVGWRPDETVLWSGANNTSACDLSEPLTNFTYLEIWNRSIDNGGGIPTITRVPAMVGSADLMLAGGVGGAVFKEIQFSATDTHIGVMKTLRLAHPWATTGTATYTNDHTDDMNFIYKVVGINRKENV